MFYRQTRATGFTLLELLMAIVLASTGLMALMHLMSIAIFADADLDFTQTSLHLAQEKLEELHGLDYASITSGTESSIAGFDFVDDRVTTVNEIQTDLKDVTVTVRWTQKGGQESVSLRSYIVNM